MASKKKNALPFDQRGSRIVFRTHFLKSETYLTLSPQAKVLIQLLQMHWNNFKPVDYGVREAAEKIPCAFGTARKAFNQLQKRGFIVVKDYSVFSSTTESKARSWRLTWLPFNSREPTNDWEKWTE